MQELDMRICSMQDTEIDSTYSCHFKTCEMLPMSEQRLESESWERRALQYWETGYVSIEDRTGPTDTNRWSYR